MTDPRLLLVDLFPVGPWALIELTIGLLGVITIGKLAVILLAVLRDLLTATIETLLTLPQLLRGTGDDGQQAAGNDGRQRALNHPARARDPDNDAAMADGGAYEPPPNVLWPPEDAFQEDEP